MLCNIISTDGRVRMRSSVHILTFVLLLPVVSLAEQLPLISSHKYGPSIEAVQQNAPHIFNAVHSSMRQWGSSLKHNGLSFFPASIPAHTHLYHGTSEKEAVKGMEWLAFEIEHAEAFARPRRTPHKKPGEGPPEPPQEGTDHIHELGNEYFPEQTFSAPNHENAAGYLHIYQTTRILSRLLYIDGMSAGKSKLGTLDSQDLILRNFTGKPSWRGEMERAHDLCDLGQKWNIEGFIRMEAGFELILCDFTNGLELISARRRDGGMRRQFEYMRAVTARFQGITAGRVEIDYSSMISAFFYPINLTNPDSKHAELPRLLSSQVEGIYKIHGDLHTVLDRSLKLKHEQIDWQGVVDMIVTRYSDRLQYMLLKETTQDEIIATLATLLGIYIDYDNLNIPSARNICAYHYLNSTHATTTSDHFIREAIATVSHKICDALFEAHSLFFEVKDDLEAVENAQLLIQQLTYYLDWTTWVKCGGCAYDEVCYVAVWPWGSPEDHYHPRCKKSSEDFGGGSYWNS
jgi:hypothetical protein